MAVVGAIAKEGLLHCGKGREPPTRLCGLGTETCSAGAK